MIKVDLPDKTIGISFRHSDVEVLVPGTGNQVRKTKGTYCEIFLMGKSSEGIEYARWLYEASAIVGVGDQFRKDIGRKMALTRALKHFKPLKQGEQRANPLIMLGKKERSLIWDAYHKRGKKVEAPDAVL